MANRILTPKVYANTMLKLLKNNLVMSKLVTTRYSKEFKKVGQTVYVKRPPQFVIREGRVAQVQDVTVGETPVNLDYQCGIDLEFSSIEETLSVDELLMDETMNSKAATLAQEIDSKLMSAIVEFPDWVGTPGQNIDSPADFFLAPERLDDKAVPPNMRGAVLSTRDYWRLASNFLTGNQFDNGTNKTALEKAKLPMMGGLSPYMTQGYTTVTTGTRTNGAIAGADQNVAYTTVADSYTQTINIDGLGANATISKGEVFTITDVFAVNPRTKQALDYEQQFVVLEDAVADGSGAATLTIANPIITSGAYQTVDSVPADGAVVTWLGAASTAYRQNAAFHKASIALASAKLVAPRTGKFSYATDKQTGISIRYWQTSDGTNDTHMHRWDVLFGVTNVDRRLGTRMSGTA